MHGTRGLRALLPLVGVLVWAVVLMHSLAMASRHTAGAAPAVASPHSMCCLSVSGEAVAAGMGMDVDGGGAPMPGHGPDGVAHLCPAVLGALVAGALGIGFFRCRTDQSCGTVADGRLTAVVARPPPKPAGRAVLTSLCLLRV